MIDKPQKSKSKKKSGKKINKQKSLEKQRISKLG